MGLEIAAMLTFLAFVGGYVWGVRDGRRQCRDDKVYVPTRVPEASPLTGDSVSVLMQKAIDRANASK